MPLSVTLQMYTMYVSGAENDPCNPPTHDSLCIINRPVPVAQVPKESTVSVICSIRPVVRIKSSRYACNDCSGTAGLSTTCAALLDGWPSGWRFPGSQRKVAGAHQVYVFAATSDVYSII